MLTPYQAVCARIKKVALESGRSMNDIQLVAVSKGRPVELIQALYSQGQRHFAENRVDEACKKIRLLSGLGIKWHFIGRLQSRKCRDIVTHFSYVHGLSRVDLVQKLDQLRSERSLPPLNVFIQCNVSNDPAKEGCCDYESALRLCDAVGNAPHLKLKGLMTILAKSDQGDRAKSCYDLLSAWQAKLIANGFDVKDLSMGMSGDYGEAIAAGSNWLRIGRALFEKGGEAL